jgi:hypothetical protein
MSTTIYGPRGLVKKRLRIEIRSWSIQDRPLTPVTIRKRAAPYKLKGHRHYKGVADVRDTLPDSLSKCLLSKTG